MSTFSYPLPLCPPRAKRGETYTRSTLVLILGLKIHSATLQLDVVPVIAIIYLFIFLISVRTFTYVLIFFLLLGHAVVSKCTFCAVK